MVKPFFLIRFLSLTEDSTNEIFNLRFVNYHPSNNSRRFLGVACRDNRSCRWVVQMVQPDLELCSLLPAELFYLIALLLPRRYPLGVYSRNNKSCSQSFEKSWKAHAVHFLDLLSRIKYRARPNVAYDYLFVTSKSPGPLDVMR